MTAARVAVLTVSVVAAALAAPAAAYVRTAPTGVPVFWPVPLVTYALSSEPAYACCTTRPCDPAASAGAIEAAVRASFDAWQHASFAAGEPGCTDLRLLYGGRIPDIRLGLAGTAEHLVIVRKGWCSNNPAAVADPCMSDPDADCGNLYDCFDDGPSGQNRSTVALTTVLYDPGTGRLYDADMEVNGWDGLADGTALPTARGTYPSHGYYFTCDTQPSRAACTAYGQSGCNGYDLRNTVTHEAGHFIGLSHPCGDPGTPACNMPLPPFETVPYDQRAMYPNTSVGDLVKRTLSPDDVAGVCAIYPSASAGCGSGPGAGPGALAALLALLALRPRTCPPERMRGRVRR